MDKNFYKKNSNEAKNVQKIINSKSSKELKFEYIGDTKNNLPHTPNGYGKKTFEFVDEARREQVKKQLQPPISILDLGLEHEEPKFSKPNYDLELLRDYAQNTYIREYFHFCGQRIFELAEYKNGKPHGAVHLSLGIDDVDYVHNFYCIFKNGLPHGICFYNEIYEDKNVLLKFDKGQIISYANFEDMEYENIIKTRKKFKANKFLWQFMCKGYLDVCFGRLLGENEPLE